MQNYRFSTLKWSKYKANYTKMFTEKATDTGLIMQYTSVCQNSLKFGLTNFYLNRVLNICSSFTAFKKEITKIDNLLLENKYPKTL